MIIRTEHNRTNPYAQINKQVLEDDRLSWKAKGVICYLLSRPDNWKTYISQLVTVSTDKETATRAAINELITAGYIKRFRRTNSKGVVTDWQYVISEIPSPDVGFPDVGFPDVGFPDVGFPDVGFPDVENQALINKEINKKDFQENGSSTRAVDEETDFQAIALANKAANLAKKQLAKAVVAEKQRNFIEDSPWGELAKEMGKDPKETFNAFKSHLEAVGKAKGKDVPEDWAGAIADRIWNNPGSELNNSLWLEFEAAYRKGESPQTGPKQNSNAEWVRLAKELGHITAFNAELQTCTVPGEGRRPLAELQAKYSLDYLKNQFKRAQVR